MKTKTKVITSVLSVAFALALVAPHGNAKTFKQVCSELNASSPVVTTSFKDYGTTPGMRLPNRTWFREAVLPSFAE